MKKPFFTGILLTLILSAVSGGAVAQFFSDHKLPLNEDGSHYIKFTLLAQVWARFAQYNPGSTLYGYPKSEGTDLGIRRYRVQFYGQMTDRVFVYSQFGENNFNSISSRKLGFFVHDALGEYAVVPEKLSMGGGLTAWSGLSRFAGPSAGSILGVDAPLYQQATNDVTDQFLRKLAIYAKGKWGKLDYRLAVADPMAFQNSPSYNGMPGEFANFTSFPQKKQFLGYLNYQFFDLESNLTPYYAGTYLGKKKVLTIGAGWEYQQDAMWLLSADQLDTLRSDMLLWSADVFYDAPIGDKGASVSAYLCYSDYDFGKGHLRNLGPMNPINGNDDPTVLNGGGVGFPAFGTGSIVYAQLGYKFPGSEKNGRAFMPYVAAQFADFERLNEQMLYTDLGLNILMNEHESKLTIGWRNRPIYQADGKLSERLNSVIAQFQVYFN